MWVSSVVTPHGGTHTADSKSESEEPSCPSGSGSGLHFPETLAHIRPTHHSPAGPSASGEGEVQGEQPRSWGLD